MDSLLQFRSQCVGLVSLGTGLSPANSSILMYAFFAYLFFVFFCTQFYKYFAKRSRKAKKILVFEYGRVRYDTSKELFALNTSSLPFFSQLTEHIQDKGTDIYLEVSSPFSSLSAEKTLLFAQLLRRYKKSTLGRKIFMWIVSILTLGIWKIFL